MKTPQERLNEAFQEWTNIQQERDKKEITREEFNQKILDISTRYQKQGIPFFKNGEN